MSSWIEGDAADLGFSVGPGDQLDIDARATARLDSLDVLCEVREFPSEAWAAVVMCRKPASGALPHGFSDRQRLDELSAALDASGRSDVLYIQSTLSPVKRGSEGKKWPSFVVFVFSDAGKHDKVVEALRTAFVAPAASYTLALERMEPQTTASEAMTFRAWRTAKRPIISICNAELSIRRDPDANTQNTLLLRALVGLAVVGLLVLLVR